MAVKTEARVLRSPRNWIKDFSQFLDLLPGLQYRYRVDSDPVCWPLLTTGKVREVGAYVSDEAHHFLLYSRRNRCVSRRSSTTPLCHLVLYPRQKPRVYRHLCQILGEEKPQSFVLALPETQQ